MLVSMLVGINLFIQAAQEALCVFHYLDILAIVVFTVADLSYKTIVHYVKVFYTV